MQRGSVLFKSCCSPVQRVRRIRSIRLRGQGVAFEVSHCVNAILWLDLLFHHPSCPFLHSHVHCKHVLLVRLATGARCTKSLPGSNFLDASMYFLSFSAGVGGRHPVMRRLSNLEFAALKISVLDETGCAGSAMLTCDSLWLPVMGRLIFMQMDEKRKYRELRTGWWPALDGHW